MKPSLVVSVTLSEESDEVTGPMLSPRGSAPLGPGSGACALCCSVVLMLLGSACLRSPPLSASEIDATSGSSTSGGGTTAGEAGTSESSPTHSGPCGDGILGAGEECDDGDEDDSDECLSTCIVARCGDGFVRSGVEQCDDGNLQDGDGCSSTCDHELRVFVSSVAYSGTLSPTYAEALSGLERADANCQNLAVSAGLQGKFRAWLSASAGSPSSRFGLDGSPDDGRFVLLNGTLVAESWADLVDGTLLAGIDQDETGHTRNGVAVWTSTTAAGGLSGSGDCNNWSATSDSYTARIGISNLGNTSWTDNSVETCNQWLRLYCFQVTVD